MIYVEMFGRMGNQMFRYSCARAFQIKMNSNEKIAVDFSKYPTGKGSFSENYLQKMNCAGNIEEKQYVFRLYQKLLLKGSSLCLKLTGKPDDKYTIEKFQKKTVDFFSAFGLYIYRRGYHKFKIRKQRDIFLAGNFEAHAYFDDIREQIIEDFRPLNMSAEGKAILKRVSAGEYIAVCVRKGDFTDKRPDRLDICTPEYYKKGIEYIRKECGRDLPVIVFTLDIDWAKENINIPGEVEYLGKELDTIEQMQIMAACNHFVICNSTYFWWAQYLCEKQGKIVVAPSYWNGRKKKTDLYMDEWVLIDPE